MFKSISWQQFLIVAATLIAIYYLIVVIIFYRREAQRLTVMRKPANPLPDQPSAKEEDEQFTQATLLKSSVDEIIGLAAHQSWIKDDLLTGLASRIEVYPRLRTTPFQIAINNYILQESKARCNILLHADDLKLIW